MDSNTQYLWDRSQSVSLFPKELRVVIAVVRIEPSHTAVPPHHIAVGGVAAVQKICEGKVPDDLCKIGGCVHDKLATFDCCDTTINLCSRR